MWREAVVSYLLTSAFVGIKYGILPETIWSHPRRLGWPLASRVLPSLDCRLRATIHYTDV